MSEPKAESNAKSKTRSPIERFLVWGAIAILGLLVFLEFQSQKNFNTAMEWLTKNEFSSQTLTEVKAALKGASEFEADATGTETAVGFKWPSLFKTYELVVIFNGDGESAKLTGFYDNEAMKFVADEIQRDLNTPASAEDLDSEADGTESAGAGTGASSSPVSAGGGSPSEHAAPEAAKEGEGPAEEKASEEQ